ncbi:hypothetical protein QTJ16_002603 [Diplocarpon rosae]|uniref:Mitochondrial carrier protein pet8 n=1 Tax=Diplocarpon rosae TaxID=946125 RepID=A0AAD9T2M8_9HELO|nr:hypothetical protein QTJ16_002603 [Diplocarpon rosae]PBP23224.1 SNARE domain-containing protein [Diplocarpon rosae]
MSFLLRTSRLAAARPAAAARPFSSTGVRALKESDRHNPDQAESNEKHKQDTLQKQKDGKGHWKPELASDSEEAITADRHSTNDSVEEMQKKTKEHIEKKHKHGTSQDPGL